MNKLNQAKDLLKHVWGHDSFRHGQEVLIQSVLSANHTIGVLPTGSGKSLTYQIPALLSDGVCIVVSPLIALMNDQVTKLKERRINAAAIHSGFNNREIDIILDNCIYGNVKILFVSPERLKSTLFIARVRKMNVSLLAIDEAHCISQWGHDFRPSYLLISEIYPEINNAPILALTATANNEVIADIKTSLKIPNAKLVKRSFLRENLAIQIIHHNEKIGQLKKLVQQESKSGIIYVRHRKTAYEIYNVLKDEISCDFYHAGLSHKEREQKQEAWISDKIKLIIATNAFGMGIDKSSVRYVIHYGISPSIEEYYQEIGRAGRDMLPSRTYVIYNDNDINRLLSSHHKSYPAIASIKKAYTLIHNYYEVPVGSGEFQSFPLDIAHFAKYCNSSIAVVYRLLKQIEKLALIKLSSGLKTNESIRLLVDREFIFELKGDYRKVAIYLLRNIENIIQSTTKINSRKIANQLEMTHDDLLEILKKMDQLKFITYRGTSEKPVITLIQNRFRSENIYINENEYSTRKERELFRNESMIKFLSSSICRMKFILDYFGEQNELRCGICDVCMKDDFYQTYKKGDIENMIISRVTEGESISDLVDKFESYKRETVLSVVNEMIDDEILFFKDYKVYSKNTN